MSDQTRKISICFRIRGFGTGQPSPYAQSLTYRRSGDGLITWSQDGEDVTPALQEIPKSIKRSIDPFTGDVSIGMPTPLTLEYDDSIAQIFDPPLSAGTTASLTEDLPPDETTAVGIDQAGLDNTVVWIDREAIWLGDYDSQTGQYVIRGRDVWGLTTTSADPHEAGSQIFTAIPRWKSMEVELTVEDGDTQGGHLCGAGLIKDISASGPVAKLDVRDRLGPPLKASVGREQVNLLDIDGVTGTWYRKGGGEQPAQLSLDIPSDFESQVYPDFQGENRDLWVAVDGESLYFNPHKQTFGAPLAAGKDPGIDFGDGDTETPVQDAEVYEVIVGGDFLFDSEAAALPQQDVTDPMELVTSLYETAPSEGMWQPEWGLATNLWDDVPSTGPSMDRLILGGDGEVVDPWATFLEPMRFFGILTRVGIDDLSGGQKEIGYEGIRWGLPTVNNVDGISTTVSNVAHSITFEGRLDASYDEIEAQLGGTLGSKPRPVTATPVGLPDRAPWQEEDSTEVEIPWLNPENWDAIEPHLVSALYRHQQTWNRVSIDVPRYAPGGQIRDPQPGDWLEIDDLGVRGEYAAIDGERIDISAGAESVVAWVQSVELDIASQVFTIGALIPGTDPVLLRAPAPIIQSVQTDTPTSGTHTLNLDEEDPALLVGEELTFCHHTLTPISGEDPVIVSTTSTGDPSTIEVTGPAPSSAVEGSTARLSTYSEQDYGGSISEERTSIYFDLPDLDIYGV
jgi:hypothetical protein